MPNALYAKGKEKILSGSISFPSDTIRVALVSNAYNQNIATDEFLTSLGANILGTPQTLASKTVTDGAFDAADVTFQAITLGSVAKCVVVYKDTGTAGTSPLLAFIDVITGFPMATNGGDITVQWDNSTFRIFSL
jgi:hypothetical protein